MLNPGTVGLLFEAMLQDPISSKGSSMRIADTVSLVGIWFEEAFWDIVGTEN